MNTGDYKSLFDIPRNIYAIRPLNKDCDVCHGKAHADIVIAGIRIGMCKKCFENLRDVCHAAVNKEWEEQEEWKSVQNVDVI